MADEQLTSGVFTSGAAQLPAAGSSQLLAHVYVNFSQACAVQWPFKAEMPLFLLYILRLMLSVVVMY